MEVQWIKLSQDPTGRAFISMILDVPPSEVSEACRQITDGKRYTVEIKPYREPKTKDQLGAIWGKIGEIANALGTTKDEIYEICLKRYGPSILMRIPAEAIGSIERIFKIVVVKEECHDGTAIVEAYKGLSYMDTAEASRFLDKILDECEEVGISREIRHG